MSSNFSRGAVMGSLVNYSKCRHYNGTCVYKYSIVDRLERSFCKALPTAVQIPLNWYKYEIYIETNQNACLRCVRK